MLYRAIPDKWKFYIDEEDINKIDKYLNDNVYSKQLTICPKKEFIFNPLYLTDPDNVKVIILGQDPYTNNENAMGLSFSVPNGSKLPPSLRNIFKELINEYDKQELSINSFQTDLTSWANQGVLLINTYWTTLYKQSKAHSHIGWEIITKKIIDKLIHKGKPLILVAWGKDALKIYLSMKLEWFPVKSNTIYKSVEYDITLLVSAHPSPLAGNKFIGCNHFIEINKILIEKNIEVIDWLSIKI